MRIANILFCLALVVAGVGAAQAAVVYEAEMTGAMVVPPSGSGAYGQATLIVNDDETLVYLTVNFAGLETPQTYAQLHIGAVGEAGTFYMELPLGTPLAQTMDFTPEIGEALANDTLIIQIADEEYPAGNIRGNFEFVTVRDESTNWSQVKSLF